MAATKTNERPGTRAQLRYARVSATKARLRGATLRRIRATLTDDIAALTLG